ncbi:hypothetical protein [Streptomyces sp. NPDC050534]|uniref:hypothetical protein n=1 Tax=Streptomyces sp. NPDC050534 TaxID=3365625 RepID=UPI0037AB932A
MHHPRRTFPATSRTLPALSRTSPVTARARSRIATVVTAAVLALLAALCVAGPAGTANGQVTDATATTGGLRDAGPRADDGCGATCTLSAATRHTPHGEHPAPRNHLAPGPDDSTAITPPRPAAHPATTRRVPSPEPSPTPDRDRAPPPSSGI